MLKKRGQYLFGGIDILSTSAIFADDEITLINDRLKNISFAKNHCGVGQTIVLFTHHSEGIEICRTEKNQIEFKALNHSAVVSIFLVKRFEKDAFTSSFSQKMGKNKFFKWSWPVRS